MNIVILVLLFLYSIGVFWILWKASDNWRWYHIVIALMIFFLAIPILPLTASVLKSRTTWAKLHQDLEESLQRAELEQARWINGVPGDPTRDPGLLEMQASLRGLNAEVGRVFRDMEVRNRDPNGITLAKTAAAPAMTPDGLPPDPNANPAPQPDPNAPPMLAAESIVYAFAEGVQAQDGPVVPRFYLGEFRVSASTSNTVTLVATAPPDPVQLREINQQPRWALYELMPTDSHEAFIAEGSEGDDDQIFGRVDAELIRSLMPNIPPAKLEEYLRDGTQALADDIPEARWVKIEFTKKHEVIVDAMEQRSASDGNFFDALGQAVDARLQRGEGNQTISFDPQDQLTVPVDAAQDLVMQGVAVRVDEYFVRPLNNYRTMIHDMTQQIQRLDDQAETMTRQAAVLQSALDTTTALVVQAQERRGMLEKDEAQVAKELAAIQQTFTDLESKLNANRMRMAQLYQSNLDAEAELEKIQEAILKAADQRATVASGG